MISVGATEIRFDGALHLLIVSKSLSKVKL
jgi:hypothetical protein